MTNNDFVEELKIKIKISRIVGKFVKLKNNGAHKFVGCCPFHQEKTPSFHLDDAKGFFHCFGCGESGDVLAFVMKQSAISFIEAVDYLAKEIGMEVPKTSGIKHDSQKKDSFYQILNAIMLHYKDNLLQKNSPSSQNALKYLKGRGFSKDIIDKFNFGYAFDDDRLAVDLSKIQTNAIATAKELGILRGEGPKPYDLFSGRLIIPIYSHTNEVIGFGARILSSDKNKPKYINSSDSPVFKKSNLLFNLSRARIFSQKHKLPIVVVEGYLDVVACAQIGYDGLVAPLGTAITIKQIHLLTKNSAIEPVFCLNSDDAGKKAMARAAKLILEVATPTSVPKFALLPSGYKDVDEMIQAGMTLDDFKNFISNAGVLELQDFIWQFSTEDKEMTNPNVMAKVRQELRDIIKTITDKDLRQSYGLFFKNKLDEITQVKFRNGGFTADGIDRKRVNNVNERQILPNNIDQWAMMALSVVLFRPELMANEIILDELHGVLEATSYLDVLDFLMQYLHEKHNIFDQKTTILSFNKEEFFVALEKNGTTSTLQIKLNEVMKKLLHSSHNALVLQNNSSLLLKKCILELQMESVRLQSYTLLTEKIEGAEEKMAHLSAELERLREQKNAIDWQINAIGGGG